MKMLRLIRAMLLVLVVSIFAGAGSEAAIRVGAVGLTQRVFNTDVSHLIGFGGGLLFEAPLGKRFVIELGGLYLPRKYSEGSIETASTAVQVPAGLGFVFGKVVSFRLGGFYELGLSSAGGTDYGITGGLRFRVPFKGRLGLLFEPRYLYGLKQSDGAVASQEGMVLLGLQLGN